MQQTHILLVGTPWLLRHQGVVGPPIGQRRIQIFAVHIAGERPRLPHQPADDVPVVDLMLVLAPQARHPLHQFLGIPDLDGLHANPRLNLLADQTRRYRVGLVFDADGAPPPHTHALPLQALEPVPRQGPQVGHLVGDFRRPASIPLPLHGQHQLPIVVTAGEIPAATQQQRLLHRLLEMPM
jgi:hypothetical protein